MSDLTGAKWHKSTRSGGNGGTASRSPTTPDIVAFRDTKNRDGGALIFAHGEWTAFLGGRPRRRIRL